MKRTLVIGAAGFVGNHLLRLLKSEGNEVYATKLPFEKIDIDGVKITDCDITDIKSIENALDFAKPQVIYHLAAQSSVRTSWEKPSLTLNINVLGSLNLLEVCRNYENNSKPRIILIGSAEEYGKVNPEMCPIKEDTPCAPSNIYALSKLTQNHLARLYFDAYGLDIVTVRAFNHAGPGQLPNFVLSDFCKQVAEIEKGIKSPVISVGNLEAKRDFTDVRDVVRAYTMLAQKGKSGETYNVGSGKAIKIADLLRKILSFSDKEIKIVRDEKRMRPSDVPLHMADITKIKNDIGWKPLIPLDITIADTLNYYRNLV